MTNVANQNDEEIIELTDVVIVGTANKGGRHTTQVAPDSMLNDQEANMSTDDILDSMLEEFPKKMNPIKDDTLENGINVHSLDGLLKSMELDDINDTTSTTREQEKEPTALSQVEQALFQPDSNVQFAEDTSIAPNQNEFAENLDAQTEKSPFDFSSSEFSDNDFSGSNASLETNIFNEDLLNAGANNESFDLMQAMEENHSIDFAQEMQNSKIEDFSQQDFSQQDFSQEAFGQEAPQSFETQNFDQNFQDFNTQMQGQNAFNGSFEDVFSQNNLPEDSINAESMHAQDLGLDGDISDIVDPNSTYNAQETDFATAENNTNIDHNQNSNFADMLNNSHTSAQKQDLSAESQDFFNADQSDIDKFPELNDEISDEFPQMTSEAVDEFPSVQNLETDDFSEFSQVISPEDSFAQNESFSPEFTPDFTDELASQNRQFEENFGQNTSVPEVNNMEASQGAIQVKNDFRELEDVDPNTLTVEDINLEEILKSSEKNSQTLDSVLDSHVLDDLSIGEDNIDFAFNDVSFDNFEDITDHNQDTFLSDLNTIELPPLSGESFDENISNFPLDAELTKSFDNNVLEEDTKIEAIDRSAFENDAELAHMLEMPENFSQVPHLDSPIADMQNVSSSDQTLIDQNDSGRINTLEEKLDAFSSNTTGRLEILQNSVDTLSSQVSSIEEHINVPPLLDPSTAVSFEENAQNNQNNTVLMQKLESKVKTLETRIEKLEEFFEAQVMLHSHGMSEVDIKNDMHSTSIMPNTDESHETSMHASTDTSIDLDMNIMREDMVRVMARLEELEANMEKNVAITAARVLKEEIIPLLTEV